MSWQRANIQAAVTYLREQMKAGPASTDARVKVIFEGLIEVLEPARRTVRLQREATEVAKAVPVAVTRDRRHRVERRDQSDRRLNNLGAPSGIERAEHRPARRPGSARALVDAPSQPIRSGCETPPVGRLDDCHRRRLVQS